MKTVRPTLEEMLVYKATARARHQKDLQALVRRQKRAWELAQRAANLLREQFGVTRVKVFGSLVHEGCFTPWSDVDLAAWDIQPQDTFRAMGEVADLDQEIEVNLVDVNVCRPELLTSIEREGVDL